MHYEIRSFVNALFYVYYILIIIRIAFSWTGIPSGKTALMIFRFVYDVTEPYLGLFRRFIRIPGPIDFSPFIGILVLSIIQGIVVSMF